ncbi:MAG: ATP phosphoribosyltransferase [Bacteroidota bacterium]
MSTQLRIALPKGRIYGPTIDLLARASIRIPNGADSRRLITTDAEGKFELVALKPVDIPVYVESGAIDAGIVGTDILRELESDVYEPVDLRIGLCRIVVAAPVGNERPLRRALRVATKYPRTAERHFRRRHSHVHIVKLDGSVEIAPLLGLADSIVDLVETGRTLRENGLRVVEEIANVSSKLIVNRTAMKMKSVVTQTLINNLDAVVYENS